MKNNNYSLVLKSNLSELPKLERFVEKISDEFNIGHTYFSNIIVSLTELAKNAIIHGNNYNFEKKVLIDFEQKEGKLRFSITDEGKGFSKGIPNLYDESSYDNNESNGLFIVKYLSDNIEFHKNGSQIVVDFNIASANELLSLTRINILKQGQIQEQKRTINE
jgi:anti-sigma regulatory factor (Ser/Thr protein kinase)